MDDQDLDLQLDALRQAASERIYEEKQAGGKTERAELLHLSEAFRAGDALMVWRWDRLGRSLKNLIVMVEKLESLGVGFQSLTENIVTTTSGGK